MGSATGTQLCNQVAAGLRSLDEMSIAELRKMTRACGLSVSNGRRYYTKTELIEVLDKLPRFR